MTSQKDALILLPALLSLMMALVLWLALADVSSKPYHETMESMSWCDRIWDLSNLSELAECDCGHDRQEFYGLCFVSGSNDR